MPARIELAQGGRQYPGFLVVQPVAEMLHGLEADAFSRRRDISLRRPWSRLVSSLGRILALRRAALRVVLNEVAPENLATLERVAETIAAALPEDPLAALTTYRFYDERRCIDCPMEVSGLLEPPGNSTVTA